MRIVTRDIEIFKKLFYLKFLTTSQLTMLFFSSNKRACRRLKKLYEAGFLDRIQQNSQKLHGKGEFVYFLSKNIHRDFVGGNSFCEYKPVHVNYNKDKGIYFLEHAIEINSFLLSLENAINKSRNYTINYFPENFLVTKSKRPISIAQDYIKDEIGYTQRLIPDAVICIENSSGNKALFFLEIDRGYETITSSVGYDVRGKLEKYTFYFDQGIFDKFNRLFKYKFNGFRVLFVTTSIKRIKTIIHSTDNLGDTSFIWFTTKANITDSKILTDTWVAKYGSDNRIVKKRLLGG